MIRILACLFVFALAGPSFADPCIFHENNLDAPLNARGGKPVEIEVDIYLNDLIEIQDAKKSFVADVFFRAEWMDSRLAHGDNAACTVNQSAIWIPELQLLNRRSIERTSEHELVVAPDGRVRQTLRAYGDFSFQADLTDFPFDQQSLYFALVTGHPVEDAVLFSAPDKVGAADNLSVANWNIHTADSHASEHYIAPVDRTLSRLDVSFQAQRLTGFYTWQLLVPLFLVVMMTWTVFWLPLEFVAPRVGLVATSMLTLIAYRFSMASILPPIAYLTRLDKFMVACSVLVFAALAAVVAVTYLEGRGKTATAEQLNVWSRILAPLLFSAMFLNVFIF